jgi:hypothetical protein
MEEKKNGSHYSLAEIERTAKSCGHKCTNCMEARKKEQNDLGKALHEELSLQL